MKSCMQRFFLGILLCFFAASVYAAATSTVVIENKEQKIVNQKHYFTIKIDYPLILDGKRHPLQSVNRLVKQHVQTHMNQFRRQLVSPAKLRAQQAKYHMPMLSKTSNMLDISYDVMSSSHDLFSFRFAMDVDHFGNAHGTRTYETLTYDNKTGKVLVLNDVFIKNVDYLSILSSYSRDFLLKKLIDPNASSVKDMMVEQISNGTAPVAKNYQYWNLTPKGLLITFPPYQVAAYVYGPQEVLIPYQTLNGMLKPEIAARAAS